MTWEPTPASNRVLATGKRSPARPGSPAGPWLLPVLSFLAAAGLVWAAVPQPSPNWISGRQRVWLSWPADNGLCYAIEYQTNAGGEWLTYCVIERPMIRELVEATNAQAMFRLRMWSAGTN